MGNPNKELNKLQDEVQAIVDKLCALESQVVYLEIQDGMKLKPDGRISGFDHKKENFRKELPATLDGKQQSLLHCLKQQQQ